MTVLAPDAGAVLGDLMECLAAIGRSMQDEFSAKVERFIPHDRLVIACRDDDRTFTDVVRPLIDFDGMGAGLLSASGRELEVRGEVPDVPPTQRFGLK